MNEMTNDLLLRVKSLLPEEGGWFDTLRAWYKNAKLTRRLIEELRSDEETALLSLVVGHVIVGATPEWQGRHIQWLIPTEFLKHGYNTLQVCFDTEAQTPLILDAVSACQGEGLAKQTINLTVAEPRATAYLEMSRFSEARHQSDAWAVLPNGFLTFTLYLSRIGPVVLVLRMPEGRELPWSKAKAKRRQKLLEDVVDRVKERVKKKLFALEKQLRESRRRNDGRGDSLEGDLNDLLAYEELHRKQIERVVRAGLSVTMELVIRETGLPDDLVSRVLPTTVILDVQPAPPPIVKPVATPTVVPVMELAPAPRSTAKPAVPARSSFGKVLFLAAIISTAAVGYDVWPAIQSEVAAWTTPRVKIVSLENDQLVPAAREFQVAVTPEAPLFGSLANTELRMTVTGAVEGDMPAPRRFAPGDEPPSQIFTFKAKPNAGNEETITLTAQLFKDGQPAGKPDVVIVKTGGTRMDLGFFIKPTVLTPQDKPEVTLFVINAKPGATVSFTVTGTDGFQGKGMIPVGVDRGLPVGKGGLRWEWEERPGQQLPPAPVDAIRFTVPDAGRAGVIDTIEATINGTKITRTVRYSF